MIKKILLVLLVCFVCAAAALFFFLSSKLNEAVKYAVETYGPQVTQTSVTLEGVDLSPFSGSGNLKGLVVGNPEGFDSASILSLGEVDIALQPKTVLSDTIIIDHLHVRSPKIAYERTLTSSNFKKLIENIEAFTGTSEPAATEPAQPEAATGAQKNVVIKELIIEEGTVFVGGMGVGQEVALPRIELNNIGEGGNRESIGQASQIVLQEILKAIGPALADAGVDGVIKGALDKAGENTSETIKNATESIKGLFQK